MTEGQREAPDRPEAERYYAQHASLDVGEGGSSEAALQAAINEGARQSWKLVGGSGKGSSRSALTGKPRHQVPSVGSSRISFLGGVIIGG